MKKRLDADGMVNELKGNSSFFQGTEPIAQSQILYEAKDSHDTVIPRNHETKIPSPENIVQQIRKQVREIGKEAATHRFTGQEKQKLMELIYRFRQQGIKTSENEIARIAIHYLIVNFETANENSVLAQVLHELYS